MISKTQENLKTKKIVIAAAVSNISNFADKVFKNIEKYISLFGQYVVVIIESNSKDNTLDILKEYQKKLNIEYHSILSSHHFRTVRISQARNAYIDIINEKYNDYDYVLVIDFNDASIDDIKIESIISNFELEVDWDMVCANQYDRYYDLWALRHNVWMPFDCWYMFNNKPQNLSDEEAFEFYIRSRFIHIPQTHDPILVDSAFGGAAFIKMESFLKTCHTFDIYKPYEEVDWVSFCSRINKIYINPKFINQYSINRHVKFLFYKTTDSVY